MQIFLRHIVKIAVYAAALVSLRFVAEIICRTVAAFIVVRVQFVYVSERACLLVYEASVLGAHLFHGFVVGQNIIHKTPLRHYMTIAKIEVQSGLSRFFYGYGHFWLERESKEAIFFEVSPDRLIGFRLQRQKVDVLT